MNKEQIKGLFIKAGRIMSKKIVPVVLSLSMFFAAGCSSATSKSGNSPSTPSSTTEKAPSNSASKSKDATEAGTENQKAIDASAKEIDGALKEIYGGMYGSDNGMVINAFVINEMAAYAKDDLRKTKEMYGAPKTKGYDPARVAYAQKTCDFLNELNNHIADPSAAAGKRVADYIKNNNAKPDIKKLLVNAPELAVVENTLIVTPDDLKPVKMTETELYDASKYNRYLESFSVKNGDGYIVYGALALLYKNYPGDESGSGQVFKQKLVNLMNAFEADRAYNKTSNAPVKKSPKMALGAFASNNG